MCPALVLLLASIGQLPKAGESALVYHEDQPRILAAKDVGSQHEMAQAIFEKDEAKVGELVAGKKVVWVPARAKVKVLAVHDDPQAPNPIEQSYAECLVTDGSLKGQKLLIHAASVHPDRPKGLAATPKAGPTPDEPKAKAAPPDEPKAVLIPRAGYTPQVGDEVVLYHRPQATGRLTDAPVCSDYGALADLLQYATAGDKEGVLGLAKKGRATMIPSGTPIRVLEISSVFQNSRTVGGDQKLVELDVCKLRVLGGALEGKEVWTSSIYVKACVVDSRKARSKAKGG